MHTLLLLATMLRVYPVVCADGWVSQSGGRRGACSHHGGVGNAVPSKRSVADWMPSWPRSVGVKDPLQAEFANQPDGGAVNDGWSNKKIIIGYVDECASVLGKLRKDFCSCFVYECRYQYRSPIEFVRAMDAERSERDPVLERFRTACENKEREDKRRAAMGYPPSP